MKILALSLLRMGDVLMMAPALRGLKEKYPHGELHVLINESFSSLEKIIPNVDKWISFPRDSLQESLVSCESPLLEGFDLLQDHVKQLNRESYDIVINLTHNKVSALLMRQIQVEEKIGLQLDSYGRRYLNSGWFRYLNDYSNDKSPCVFNLTEFYHQSCQIKNRIKMISLKETNKGLKEGRFLRVGKKNKLIVIQISTSDEQKEWGDENFINMAAGLKHLDQTLSLVFLGAPSEEKRLKNIEKRLLDINIEIKVALLSLEGAVSLLKKSDLLITGDTGVKHLAGGCQIPIVELVIGWSRMSEHGVFGKGHYLVRSCQRIIREDGTFLYSKNIDSYVLASLAFAVVCKDQINIKKIAKYNQDCLEVYRTEVGKMGFLCLVPMAGERVTVECLENYLNKIIWFHLLEPSEDISQNMLRLRDDLNVFFGDSFLRVLSRENKFFMEDQKVSVHLSENSLQFIKKHPHKRKEFLNSMSNHDGLKGMYHYLKKILQDSREWNFQEEREVHESLRQIGNYIKIKNRILHQVVNVQSEVNI